MDWYVRRNGIDEGPYSPDQMKIIVEQRVLVPSDLVWHTGMKDWTSAADVSGLILPPAAKANIPAHTMNAHPSSKPQPSTKAGWFSKIRSRDQAEAVVRDTSSAFFFVGALTAIAALILGASLLVDAVIYVIGGFFLRRYNSRSAAVVLLVISSIGLLITLLNKAGADLGGGQNIFLAVLVLWASIRSVDATFKLHGRFQGAESGRTT